MAHITSLETEIREMEAKVEAAEQSRRTVYEWLVTCQNKITRTRNEMAATTKAIEDLYEEWSRKQEELEVTKKALQAYKYAEMCKQAEEENKELRRRRNRPPPPSE